MVFALQNGIIMLLRPNLGATKNLFSRPSSFAARKALENCHQIWRVKLTIRQ
jgi:hypothetical protein